MADSAVSAPAETLDQMLIQSLNKLDFKAAQAAVLGIIHDEVGKNRSWDSPYYLTSRKVQESIKQDLTRNERLTFFALDTLRDRYLLRRGDGKVCETPQDFWARVATGVACGAKTAKEVEKNPRILAEVCSYAQELYDVISQLHALFATPVLTNAGTNRGMAISCFLSSADDSINGIYDAYTENAILAKGGGGIGTYWGHLRSSKAALSRGGKSSGPIPFLKVKNSSTLAVHQAGANRRGAAAAYMQVSHPDIEDFVDIRRPEGAEERRCQDLHHGVCITDAFMEAVRNRAPWDLIEPNTGKVVRTIDAYGLWKRIIMTRVMTGEPYMLFIDTVNKHQPETNKALGLKVETSNLCAEISLPTLADRVSRFLRRTFGNWRVTIDRVKQNGRTAICCLGSLNYGRYDEWSSYSERLCYLMVRGLDNILDHFIRNAPAGYEKAIEGAKRGRDIGLGVMGWFDYLQQRGIPFESIEARSHNRLRFKEFGESSDKASRLLALERGPAPDCLKAAGPLRAVLCFAIVALGLSKFGFFQWLIEKAIPRAYLWRNVNRQAIAPTASIGIIAGASPSIEPPAGNAFLQKTLSGTFVVRNQSLDALLAAKYPQHNHADTWASIMEMEGSIQHFEWMDEDDKKVFKTAFEINQRDIVIQAAARQQYISQAQSVNLFFAPGASLKISAAYLHDVHFRAWEMGVKSLYYVRSGTVLQTMKIANKSGVLADKLAIEECSVCQ